MTKFMGVINTPCGGGSWYSASTKEEAAKRVVRLFKNDWKGLFKLKGPTVKVPIYDVTDRDVWIKDDGVQDQATKEWLRVVDHVEIRV